MSSRCSLARLVRLRRHELRDRQLTLHRLDGSDETRTLATSAELRDALQGIFGIDLSAVSGLDERFDRLA